jgi:ABC-type taurine transport system ATPase subunit
MQQRCQIARTLANDPQIMLMDEPFGALDALTRERLQLELLNIWRATHKTILFITHSVEEAIFLGSRVIVMSPQPGRIVFDEPVDFSPVVGHTPGAELRTLPEFVALRDRVKAAIYESGG